jgi:hypothetical protein
VSGASIGLRRAACILVVVATAATVTGAARVKAATAGWQGEAIISLPATGDGWEPAVAADPAQPYVYSAWMQYSGPGVSIYERTSADGGSTWGPAAPLCASCGKGEYDVTLATATTGAVYATYMQGNHIEFTKSTNHAATWSTPLQISGGTWADKPWMTTSANGVDVYVMWATRGNAYAVSSHNSGASFSAPVQITNEQYIYYYPNGGTVLTTNGTVVMAAAEYPEKGNNTKNTGPINIVAFRSTNGGVSWQRTVVDVLNTGASFATSSVATVASDASGNLVLLYSGSTSVGANGKVYVRRSSDSGATWSAATELTTSAGGADATSVAAAGKGSEFVITWMDKRTGAWNVWERQSTDGGVTWTPDAKVSDAVSGASYKTSLGFGFPYGDYDTVAINSAGKAVAVTGEGDTNQLHGDIWVNRQI